MGHLFYRLHLTGNLNYQTFEIIFLILFIIINYYFILILF